VFIVFSTFCLLVAVLLLVFVRLVAGGSHFGDALLSCFGLLVSVANLAAACVIFCKRASWDGVISLSTLPPLTFCFLVGVGAVRLSRFVLKKSSSRLWFSSIFGCFLGFFAVKLVRVRRERFCDKCKVVRFNLFLRLLSIVSSPQFCFVRLLSWLLLSSGLLASLVPVSAWSIVAWCPGGDGFRCSVSSASFISRFLFGLYTGSIWPNLRFPPVFITVSMSIAAVLVVGSVVGRGGSSPVSDCMIFERSGGCTISWFGVWWVASPTSCPRQLGPFRTY